jgi:hypothetical protein
MFTFSCAGENIAVRQEKHRAALQSWMDHDVNDLIRSWGYPQQVNDMPNGNKLITYQRITQRTNPVMMLPQTTTYDVYGNTIYKNQGPGMMIGGDTETFYCTINFEINQQGRIIFFKSEGNNCY